jgi:hypothetical protein
VIWITALDPERVLYASPSFNVSASVLMTCTVTCDFELKVFMGMTVAALATHSQCGYRVKSVIRT